ncbi:MAG: DNA polymerase III subunit alpha [Pseudomonadota bacterium]
MSRFIHLRATTAYSLLEGAMTVSALVKRAEGLELEALGLCDRANLFGALEFSEAAAAAGIQPIIGTFLPTVFAVPKSSQTDRRGVAKKPGGLSIFAATEEGYLTLLRLSSRAHLEGVEGVGAAIKAAWLLDDNEGLIVASGGEEGVANTLVADGNEAQATAALGELQRKLGDRFYVELQRYGRDGEEEIEAELVNWAYCNGAPLVATNAAYFGSTDDYDAHDVLLSIGAGTVLGDRDRKRVTPNHHLQPPSELANRFKDLPEAIENTIELATRCRYRPRKAAPILPAFTADVDGDMAARITAENAVLKDMATAGLRHRIDSGEATADASVEEYEKQLAYELDVIENMQYAGYFLIVADFIQWAKDQGIPVGPGRGSGAGSVVAWSLKITDIDPLRFGLLFERFLNPERVSMPDFDIDFCPERRDEVIAYVQRKYGHDQVAQIITFGTLQARAVMRDVGRALQMPYGQVDGLCKLVPHNPTHPVKLKEAIDSEPQLQMARDEEPIVKQLLDTSVRLEGLYRHPSTHAAGIVIGDRPLDQLVPLFRDPRSEMPVTQFNMKWVENAGLVKFDFLGLKTLTVLDRAVKLLSNRSNSIDLNRLPLDDEKTFQLLSSGATVGIFQLESAGMRDALRVIEPDRFEDIIALVSLYRPGPMENIPTYGARKHKREEPDYLHPKLEPILGETYGVIIYQEQVMEIARVLSGYSLGEADLLRRAMGKKIRAEMAKQRTRFVDGARENDVPAAQAEMIFDLVARFADYGFNKSHAAAYALVAYQTAYIKANYPVEFFAAAMSVDLGNTDKLAEFYRDAKTLGVEVRPPDINQGVTEFSVRDGAIDYGLGALRNVGRAAVDHLVRVRGLQPFMSLQDFASRVDAGEIGRKALEGLANAGAFDTLDVPRHTAFASVDAVLETAQRESRDREAGQTALFAESTTVDLCLVPSPSWTEPERLNREFDSLGFFVSGHPIDAYADVIKKQGVATISEFAQVLERGGTVGRLGCVITQRQDKRGRKGARYAILQVSDPGSQSEIFVFSDVLAAYGDVLTAGAKIIAHVEGELRNGEVRLTLSGCSPLDDVSEQAIDGLTVYADASFQMESFAQCLPGPGKSWVTLVLSERAEDGDVHLQLAGRYAVSLDIVAALKAVQGVDMIETQH